MNSVCAKIPLRGTLVRGVPRPRAAGRGGWSVLPQDSRSRQFVYVIRNPENDRIKIGVSNNVEKRLHILETGAGTKLDLVYKSIVCSNAFDIENMVHKHFNEYRIFGEWFQVDTSKVINFLEQQQYVLKSEFAKYVSVIGKER